MKKRQEPTNAVAREFLEELLIRSSN